MVVVCVILIYFIVGFEFDDFDYVVDYFSMGIGFGYMCIGNLIVCVVECQLVLFELGVDVVFVVSGQVVVFIVFFLVVGVGDYIVLFMYIYEGMCGFFFDNFVWLDIEMMFVEDIVDLDVW